MSHSQATLTTERSSRYLQQLCKHFEHKLDVSFTPEEGQIAFPFGICKLAAAGDLLTMRAEAENTETLDRLENVVAKHLERFAFRDMPEITWQRES